MSTRRPQTMRFFVSLAALVALAACSGSTAPSMTDLTMSKSKDMSSPTTAFGASDTVYAQTGVANNPGKVTMNWHFIAENVKGVPPNSLQKNNDVSNDLSGDTNTSTYTLTPPASGWPTGTYKIVVDMMIDGAQKAEKTTEFTVQ